jgi:hypothetical protein
MDKKLSIVKCTIKIEIINLFDNSYHSYNMILKSQEFSIYYTEFKNVFQ